MAPDVAFICINGKLGNMNYSEAALYADILRAKTAVPTHYDTIENNTENPENFINALSRLAPDTKGVILTRGVEVDAAMLY
jgi:L-ascorbate 6-phosphate lactonase